MSKTIVVNSKGKLVNLVTYKVELKHRRTDSLIRVEYADLNSAKKLVQPDDYKIVGICRTVTTPSKDVVKSVRKNLKLSVDKASCLIGVCCKSWRRYEDEESDIFIPKAEWEVFLMKTGIASIDSTFF